MLVASSLTKLHFPPKQRCRIMQVTGSKDPKHSVLTPLVTEFARRQRPVAEVRAALYWYREALVGRGRRAQREVGS